MFASFFFFFFFLMIRRPPRSTLSSSSAASDVYKRQILTSLPSKTRIVFSTLLAIESFCLFPYSALIPVSYTHLRAHETPEHLVCRLLLEKKKKKTKKLQKYEENGMKQDHSTHTDIHVIANTVR
eukprot:TRINITY_DN387_c0_g1_i4.p1 TRINITY_DN387_c0_g1~~TRINITY_DN387_c0_g1_i4.p1  ORF type:complete len:125 (+),score=37.62 TRINITY_DN387_c0_g1_i4:89-463(+)